MTVSLPAEPCGAGALDPARVAWPVPLGAAAPAPAFAGSACASAFGVAGSAAVRPAVSAEVDSLEAAPLSSPPHATIPSAQTTLDDQIRVHARVRADRFRDTQLLDLASLRLGYALMTSPPRYPRLGASAIRDNQTRTHGAKSLARAISCGPFAGPTQMCP